MTRTNLTRRSFLAGTAALTPLVLAGCGAASAEDAPADAPADEAPANEFADLDTSKTLNIVTTNESYTALFDKFTEASGMKYEILSMSSGEVLSKLRAEGGAPSADL